MCEALEDIPIEDIPIFQNILRKKKEKGRAEGLADVLLLIIQTRFPNLEELTQQFIQQVASADLLKEAIVKVSPPLTEEEARQHLCSHLPA